MLPEESMKFHNPIIHNAFGVDLGTRTGFSDIGATILDVFGVNEGIAGESFLKEITK